jgi:cytochrome c oxidase cbb3-type subunit 4
MLKFIKHHMETIAGIEIYPILSFLIFFSLFTAVLVYVIYNGKSHFDHAGALPLEDGHIETGK